MLHTIPADHFDIPEPLQRIKDLAYNTWWTWHREARRLFKAIDDDLWSRYRNPVRVLLHVRSARLEELARDERFLRDLDEVWKRYEAELATPCVDKRDPVAYVSAEYALHESLPIYSGGLGVLSGDHLREASDLRLPLIAVGLFYGRGYFRQLVNRDGNQQHFYPDLDPWRMPVLRARGPDGNALVVTVSLDDRDVQLIVWVAQVGRIPLVLLDTDTPLNAPEDRFITSQLYVRGREMRLEQELVLGRGAVAALEALDVHPRLWHMNEGHSAFLALENLRRSRPADLATGIEAVRSRHAFTTHTPVPAGNEVFDTDLVQPYLVATAQDLGVPVSALLDLGHAETGHAAGFNLTALALRLSSFANGVSVLHAEVSRRMWPEHEIGAITNGIHVSTWLGREMTKVLRADAAVDPRELARRAGALSDETLWAAHTAQKHRLMRFIHVRTTRQLARHGHAPSALRTRSRVINSNALTLGFARRFAAYKRADLLFHDIDRLATILADEDRPVQLVMAGKAHPADSTGQEIIRRIWKLSGSDRLRGRVHFVEDYDMAVARLMVRGVDVWLNTPEWPHEASGTSGMKAVINGVLHASVPDGWWAEAAKAAPTTGFTIGAAVAPDTERDSAKLLDALEHEIVPLFYADRDAGLPRAWVDRMRRSMVAHLGTYSTRRMLECYARDMYDIQCESQSTRDQDATSHA